MRTNRRSTIGLALVVTVLGCSRGLSREQAKLTIEQHRSIRPADNVSIDAISSSNDTEAIVRATIAGHTTNLRLRRFDTGWTWEFVETQSGGWIAPDVALGQIREEQRAAAAAVWAKEHKDAYITTANTMYFVGMFQVPNPTAVEKPHLWENYKRASINVVKERLARGDKRDDAEALLAILTSNQWTDAWGTQLIAEFNSKDNSTMLISLGPDKTRGTGDDLSCLHTFRSGWENGSQVWYQHHSWKVPEGLGAAIEPHFDKEDDQIEYSQVIKP